jgi:ferrous iron transport protein B
MGSRRERLILATLITITVPCSAQTAIIIGSVGNYAGLLWALAIYAVLMSMLLIMGLTLHRVIRFEPTGLAIEVPDMRLPTAKQTAVKTYVRVKEFLTIAFPLLLVGSIVLEALLAAGALEKFEELAAPFMTAVLGLPAATAIALVFGILRKEMALQMLMVLYSTSNLALVLSSEEMFVFALVMAVFMPCLAAVAVLVKEFGTRNALLVSLASISLAFVLGAAAKLILGA